MLPQLQKLKTAVENAANDPERADDFIAEKVGILLVDFDYLIKKASGDSDAEMPENSFLESYHGGGFGGGGGGMF